MSDGYQPDIGQLLAHNEQLMRRIDQLERMLHERGQPVPDGAGGDDNLSGARQLHALVEGLPDTILVVCNGGLKILQIYGDPGVVGRSELSACCGWSLSNLMPDPELGLELHELGRSALHNERIQRVLSHGGRSWWCRSAPLGRTAGRALILISDHTDQERMLAAAVAQERLATVGTMAGGIAHEFNNLVGVILGHVELLLTREALSERGRQQVLVVKQACERSAHLALTMLATVRGGDGGPGQFDAVQVVDQAVELFGITARRQGIDLVWQPPPAALLAAGDAAALGQVLLNLMANAQTALSDIPGKRITVRCWGEKGRIHCAVEDNGCGISPEDRARIFRPFFSAGRRSASGGQISTGTGLGLAVCQRLIHEMGGTIEVQSSVGTGTAFRIDLALAAQLPPVQIQAASGPAAVAGPRRVMGVEDDTCMRELLSEILTDGGFEVTAAEHGREALDLLDNGGRWDGMLLDWRMPVLDGAGVLKALSARPQRLPVLICSGNVEEVWRNLPDFVRGVVRKPFDGRDLVQRLRDAIGDRP